MMLRIGLLSDTHGYLHPRIFDFFGSCDEIWHAGDIGNLETSDKLAAFKPLRAVYGNIDGHELRRLHPAFQMFYSDQMRVVMTHIGGYPGKYDKTAYGVIMKERPGLFISGHSHILKVMYDKKHSLLHINPGAAGNSGLHRVITFIRFVIEGNAVRDLEIFEAERKNQEAGY